MGGSHNKKKVKKYKKKHNIKQLPKNLKEKVLKLFSLIDIDNSNTIDRDETLKFWSKNFPKLNSNELFDQVDKNNDGSIQLEEWIEFWTIVYNSGYSEDEICNELDNMINGGSWVKFDTTEKLGGKKERNYKNEGKC